MAVAPVAWARGARILAGRQGVVAMTWDKQQPERALSLKSGRCIQIGNKPKNERKPNYTADNSYLNTGVLSSTPLSKSNRRQGGRQGRRK